MPSKKKSRPSPSKSTPRATGASTPKKGAKKVSAPKVAATTKKAPPKRAPSKSASTGAKGGEVTRLDFRDLRSLEHLMKIMGKADVQEVEIQDGVNQTLRISKRGNDIPSITYASPPMAPSAPAARPAEGDASPAEAPQRDVGTEFVSPMVGTFYRAPSPEAPPYVVPGDRVDGETVICIIEAMKVLNEIKAEMSGEIVDVLVENGEAVEYGQPLFHIRPSGS